MAGIGRISMLVSRDLQALVQAANKLEPEVRKQLRAHTRRVVQPAFLDEIRSRGDSTLEQRVLVSSARVAVSDSNVTLKAGGVGKTKSRATPVSQLASAVEFGMGAERMLQQRSRKGNQYSRRAGAAFKPTRRDGYVFHPSVRAFIPRAAALWVQTTARTIAETFEKVT